MSLTSAVAAPSRQSFSAQPEKSGQSAGVSRDGQGTDGLPSDRRRQVTHQSKDPRENGPFPMILCWTAGPAACHTSGLRRPVTVGAAGQTESPDPASPRRTRRLESTVPDLSSLPLAASFVLLVAAVGAGIFLIVAIRRRFGPGSESGSGHGDWERTLAGYKNLRDEGVLSEEEFRKIRTLVEPRTRIGMPELRPRHWPPTDPTGPATTRE